MFCFHQWGVAIVLLQSVRACPRWQFEKMIWTGTLDQYTCSGDLVVIAAPPGHDHLEVMSHSV